MRKQKYGQVVLLSVAVLLCYATVGHTQSRMETETIKSKARQVTRASRQQQMGFLKRLRAAFQDFKSKQRQLKSQTMDNELRLQKNRANEREARMKIRTQQQEAKFRMQQASIRQKQQMRKLMDLMRK
jgi:hypothetical protein